MPGPFILKQALGNPDVDECVLSLAWNIYDLGVLLGHCPLCWVFQTQHFSK